MIPLGKPFTDEREMEAIREVLESGWLAHGPKCKEFEKNFADYIGTKKAISLNSCASALQLAIQASGLKGDIILPSFTFPASANAVVNAGCNPVFVDVDFESRNIEPEKIEERITKDTAGIMPVHYAGLSCDMSPIMEISGKHDILVIEDSAEAIGSEYKGKKTGSFGIGCFSFYPVKNMTTGEGGMLTSNNEELIEKVNAYRGHGVSKMTWDRERETRPWIRDTVLPGFNFRMPDILAAMGIEQLKKLDHMNELRRRSSQFLNKNLVFDELETPKESTGYKHTYQMYTITLDIKKIDRFRFISVLKDMGVSASVHFDPPVHLNTYYKSRFGCKEDLPVTERLSNSIVTLSMYPGMSKHDLERIVTSVGDALKNSRIK
jgi:perosamine synthetase